MFDAYIVGQAIVTGFAIGSIYALIGFGFTFLWKSNGILNFAQGEAVMVGGFAGYAVYVILGLPYYLAILAAILTGAILGLGSGKALQLLKKAPLLSLIIATVGISYILRNGVQLIMSAKPRAYGVIFPKEPLLSFGGVKLSYEEGTWILVLLVLLAVFYLIFYRTEIGLKMRAMAENPRASLLMGINITKLRLLTWAIACAIGALGGVFYGARFVTEPVMGMRVLLYAITAATLGGFGSLHGVIIAGWLIGLTENLVAVLIGSEIKALLPFIIIFIVLAIRPYGLFGKSDTGILKPPD
jgi:branched-chain amino acid transport system permease protein